MTEVSRRSLLAGAAALGAAAAAASLVPPARAAAPAIGKQAAGVYRYKVGQYECTSISDGGRLFPIGDGFVRNASKDQVVAAAEAAYFPKGHLVFPFNPQVINTGSKLVLIDAGYGPGVAPTVGLLPARMAAAGIDPKAIDIVVISHLHVDHILGLRTADGGLQFPNAEVKVPTADWAFWMNDENMGKAQGMLKSFFEATRKSFAGLADKVTKYNDGNEVAPGITAISTPGHTPGHMSFAVASGSSRVLVQSDVTNIPQLFLRNPDWQIVFDMDPNQAVQSRKKFFDMAATEKAMILGYHYPFPAAGYVEKDGAGYRLVPAPWNEVL
jgi:glyoxylase-like metal-dependent hydrolase (beta-lactamase superfamily II)